MSMSPEPEEECLPASSTAAARASRPQGSREAARGAHGTLATRPIGRRGPSEMLRATDNTRTPTPADRNTRTPTPADPRLRPRPARSAKNLFDRDAMAHNLNAVDGCRSYLTLFGAVGAGVILSLIHI